MARILVFAHPASPHSLRRAVVGQQAGHRIFWVAAERADLPGVTSFSLPRPLCRSLACRAVLEPFLVARAIRAARPDLIHVFGAGRGLAALVLARFHPLVVTATGGDILPDQHYRGVEAPLVRLLLDKADRITSRSDFMDRALLAIGDYGPKIHRVTWGMELDLYHPHRETAHLRRKWSIPEGDLVFFDPRIAWPFYNKHLILAAFGRYLRSGGPPATLLIGELRADSRYVARLRALARDLGVREKVRFVGSLDHLTELPDYYVLADATISVPPSDGLPMTIFEALACGSFLIVGDLDQYRGVVEDGVTARLVKVGDEAALAEAMAWVAANPEARAGAAEKGRPLACRLADLKRQSALVNEIYAELLNGGAGGKGPPRDRGGRRR